jgi:integrase/recombinase XerD
MVKFEQVRAMLGAPNVAVPKGIRDRAILSIMFGAGMRVGEILELRLSDVKHTELGTMVLELRATKAGKDARQPLPFWAQSAVHELYMLRLDQGAAPTDYLVNSYEHTTPTQAAMSPQGVHKLFMSYARKAGVDAYVTPHSARATAITKLLADGKSHREVMEFSRHSSVVMVEGYDKQVRGVEENPGLDLEF